MTSVSMCEMRCESSISGTCNNVVCGMCGGGESRLESREQAEREIEMRERERKQPLTHDRPFAITHKITSQQPYSGTNTAQAARHVAPGPAGTKSQVRDKAVRMSTVSCTLIVFHDL